MLAHLIDAFLVSRQADGCTAKTLSWHRTSLDTFQRWIKACGHDEDVTTWNATLLRSFIVHLQGEDLRPATVTSKVQSLLAFTRWLHDEEYTEKNVGARVKKPSVPSEQKPPFTDDELRQLLATAKAISARNYAIVCLLLDCGIRASELAYLTREKVLLEQNLITVHGKGRKDRIVPISVESNKAIRRYLNKEHRGSPYLIESAKGEHLTANSLLQVINRIANRAGVADAHPHRFRHTFAISFLRRGGEALVLQRLLGHTSLNMTMRYVNFVTDDLSAAHRQFSPLEGLLKR